MHRFSRLLPVLLVSTVALSGCAADRALQQAHAADSLHDYDVAVAAYAKTLRERPGDREAAAGLDRAKLRAAEAHLARGRRLVAMGRYEDAVLELQISFDLNPTSGDTDRELRNARAAVRTKLAAPAEGRTPNETLLDRMRDAAPVGYELPNTTLGAQLTTGTQATSRSARMKARCRSSGSCWRSATR